jgi:hypothetical protein
MCTRIFPQGEGVRGWPTYMADNLTAICQENGLQHGVSENILGVCKTEIYMYIIL